MTAARGPVAAVVLTGLLLLGQVLDAPVWARTPVALAVFLAAPGLALVRPAMGLHPTLRWVLVLGLSLAVDLLGAVLLLSLGEFSVRVFLVLLLGLEVLTVLVPLVAGRRTPAVAGAGSPR